MADIITQNEHFTIWYYPEHGIVHNQFHKYTCGEPFRDCLSAGLSVLKQHNATKWISDDRDNSAVPEDDRNWTFKVWVPDIAETGWQYWAIVLPKTVVGKMNLEWFAQKIGIPGLTIQTFSDPKTALSWLIDQ